MKTTSSGIAVVLLVAMLAVQSAVADISCSDVLNDLSPCLPFLQGKAAKPSESNNQCCDGVRTLYAAADTRPDRQATCSPRRRSCPTTAASRCPTTSPPTSTATRSNEGILFPYQNPYDGMVMFSALLAVGCICTE
uniref:Nonspecific lipid-transfer protein 3 n=1 Tax=Zea mays TaxID=4577 RepID=B6TF67_MAIZE|nr:nonspecific lipid-transfer protein 3 precursor [Zea mays]